MALDFFPLQGKAMRHNLRHLSTAIIASSAFLMMSAAPSTFVPFGSEPAFAKDKGGSKGSGGRSSSRGKSESSKGSGGKSSSSKSSKSSKGKSTSAPGQSKGVAKASASAGTPKAVVRQYVIENGLKQGDVASLLKSWNSLNRNEQAYLNNMDNPTSLPGRQIAYIRDNMTAEGALAGFEAIGGDPLNPPTAEESAAAQSLIDQNDAWTAYLGADPADEEAQAGLLADFEALGGDPLNPPTEEELAAAQTLTAQYDAWTGYQDAEAAAQDAFVAASVSYNGAVYDEATYGKLRDSVDDIIGLKGLDTLVTEFDAAAAESEPLVTE